MNNDKIKEARNRTYDIYRRSARKISEFDSAILKVEIHYKLNFNTEVSKTKSLVGNTVLNPNNKLFQYHKCLNRDCTGSGFYLTDEISKAIESHKVVKGERPAMEKKIGNIRMLQDILA